MKENIDFMKENVNSFLKAPLEDQYCAIRIVLEQYCAIFIQFPSARQAISMSPAQ